MASRSDIGKWKRVKSVKIPSIVDRPQMCGFISDDEICVSNGIDSALFITNISTKHTKKVIEGGVDIPCATSCAPVDSNVIVCGKWIRFPKDHNLDGCITLYDRQWKVIRNITIPWSKFSTNSIVHVDVDRDGMILAAQYKQFDIYVINPADGKIVNTIKMKDNHEVYGQIQALSSGDIVVQTYGYNKFAVISRSGEKKADIHSDKWGHSRCHVDKLADTIYITYDRDDYEDDLYAVDLVSCDGNIQAKKIVKYEQSDRCHDFTSCLVTSSGNLVVCDGDKLFVYKQSFTK